MIGRRTFLVGGAAAAAGLLTARPAGAVEGSPEIRPRSAWGAGLPPTGPLEEEAPEDVRFLLLHHSASGNSYDPEAVPGVLGGFYRFHTDDREWPDIAYNFLVDRYGTVWEGRAGSLDGPVKGDATGGSQGFALLCCFIGDHTSEPPTAAATDAMVGLCAALALRYGIDPSPGARTSFVSRGSNRWPAGAEVETATVAGHRDMSRTTCPGDAGYRLVTEELPQRIAATVARMQEASGATEEVEEPSEADEPASGAADEVASGPAPAPAARPRPELDTAGGNTPSASIGGMGRAPRAQGSDRVAVDLSGGGTGPDRDERRWNGLGLRELTVLGVAAAAGGSAAIAGARRTGQRTRSAPAHPEDGG